MADSQYYEGVGRRKSSTARARIYPGGSGTITVNDRPGQEYFDRQGDYTEILRPLEIAGGANTVDVTVKVNGGGVTGQTHAVRHALSRAVLKWDENFRSQLRSEGLLTRDPREKERKKPGLKRARKAPTYTKR